MCEATYITARLNPRVGDDDTYRRRAIHLKIMNDVYGWQIASHGKSHYGYGADTIDLVEARVEEEITESYNALRNIYGFNTDTIVYPHGVHSHLIRAEVEKNYVAGIASGNTFAPVAIYNKPPIVKNALVRFTFDYPTNPNGDLATYAATLADMKSRIDTTKSGNGWLITMMHSAGYLWKNYNSLDPDGSYPAEWFTPVSLCPENWQSSNNHVVPDNWVPVMGFL